MRGGAHSVRMSRRRGRSKPHRARWQHPRASRHTRGLHTAFRPARRFAQGLTCEYVPLKVGDKEMVDTLWPLYKQ